MREVRQSDSEGVTVKPRLQVHYETTVRPKLRQEFGYTNAHEVPRLVKIVVNAGVGEAAQNAKLLESVIEELAAITGQKPVVSAARKSIAGFSLREGMPVGVSVTLRRERMYEFLDRFLNVAVPRVRDFRGFVTRSFDGRGNYTLGVKEQMVFPEVDYDKIVQVHGMDITVVTTAERDDEAVALLREMGFPFRGMEAVLV